MSHVPLPFFLLLGQSNMAGRGDLADIPPSVDADSEDVLQFRGGRWALARDPLQDPHDPVFAVKADGVGGVGPGIAFARAMRNVNHAPIGLLLCAKGGDGIGAWSCDGLLYREMIGRLRAAAVQGKLAGALIHVGEGDTRSEEAAMAWKDAFMELVTNLRKDTGEPSLPVVYAQVASITAARRARRHHGFAGWDVLKQVQASVEMTNVAMVTTDDLPLKADGLHLSTAGQMTLGGRFAEAMHGLLCGAPRALAAPREY